IQKRFARLLAPTSPSPEMAATLDRVPSGELAAARALDSRTLLNHLRYNQSPARGAGVLASLAVLKERVDQFEDRVTPMQIQAAICRVVSEDRSDLAPGVRETLHREADPTSLYLHGLREAQPRLLEVAGNAHRVMLGGIGGEESGFRDDMFRI